MKSNTPWQEAAKGFNGLLLIGKKLHRSLPHKESVETSKYED